RVRGAENTTCEGSTLSCPARQLLVFTGLSGSGKSSLGFDTIFFFRRRQRRLRRITVGIYALQFLGQMGQAGLISSRSFACHLDSTRRSASAIRARRSEPFTRCTTICGCCSRVGTPSRIPENR
ncbi:UNVERIFIED_CONTAM: hypothetical protein GTU68_034082, partial [Idotea baltica]|nr:hypothetical protein [Idotea baltica]